MIHFYKGDLPADVCFKTSVAVDCEMMGLNPYRDRLCLVQLGDGKGNSWLVQIIKGRNCPNLKKILTDKKILKIFHFGRYDLAKIFYDLQTVVEPVYDTKIMSKLCRTCAPNHSYKSLCWDLLGVELDKEQQTSDWGADELTSEQKEYAAKDVLYLHQLKKKLDVIAKREGRLELAQKCFDFLPIRAQLDLLGFDNPDIFSHH